ncbi:kanamycin kinase [Frondihabitans australicus]|uniref:Kanamycin kinase n=1 Tax=Frondihabitans australicus TaxID=386892 RepID=A0A495ILW0_9MICO|nr:kanamycin kinase [Frondihabitans australicus]
MVAQLLGLGDVETPPRVAELAGADTVTPVWRNEVGGLTFQLGEGPTRRFAKWAPHGRGLNLVAEEARLRWAVDYVTVPRVLASGRDDDAGWLVTQGLAGTSAVVPRWQSDPATAVTACGRALRAFHDALPVDDCPFDWSVSARLAASDKARAQEPTLPPVPPIDRLVVCHGDPCVPNTLLADDGTWSGHVDLDALGVADRWADVAVATMSLEWNYGPGWDGAFLDAYGIAPDVERTDFYRALWNGT